MFLGWFSQFGNVCFASGLICKSKRPFTKTRDLTIHDQPAWGNIQNSSINPRVQLRPACVAWWEERETVPVRDNGSWFGIRPCVGSSLPDSLSLMLAWTLTGGVKPCGPPTAKKIHLFPHRLESGKPCEVWSICLLNPSNAEQWRPSASLIDTKPSHGRAAEKFTSPPTHVCSFLRNLTLDSLILTTYI